MAEIRFPKIEVEPADLARLEAIAKRFEDVTAKLERLEQFISAYAPAPDRSPSATSSPLSAPDVADGRKLDDSGGVGA